VQVIQPQKAHHGQASAGPLLCKTAAICPTSKAAVKGGHLTHVTTIQLTWTQDANQRRYTRRRLALVLYQLDSHCNCKEGPCASNHWHLSCTRVHPGTASTIKCHVCGQSHSPSPRVPQ